MAENEIIEKTKETEGKVKKEPTKKSTSGKSTTLMQIINGDFLTKEFVINNLTFIFYFIFLLILLVGKGYYDKQLTSEVDKTQKELNDLMGDYVAKKAQLEEETKRITLVRELEPRGLKETVNPTKVIRIRK
ncbi:MAG: FtsL-like putative cell division protein [Crocinitomicaceae bacterium]